MKGYYVFLFKRSDTFKAERALCQIATRGGQLPLLDDGRARQLIFDESAGCECVGGTGGGETELAADGGFGVNLFIQPVDVVLTVKYGQTISATEESLGLVVPYYEVDARCTLLLYGGRR